MTSPSLRPEDIDKVGLTVLSLAQELWTVIERQKLIEHALAEKGIDLADLLDGEPTGELADQISADRKAFIDKIVTSLNSDTA